MSLIFLIVIDGTRNVKADKDCSEVTSKIKEITAKEESNPSMKTDVVKWSNETIKLISI